MTASPTLLVTITVQRAISQAAFDELCLGIDKLIEECAKAKATVKIYVGDKEFIIPTPEDVPNAQTS